MHGSSQVLCNLLAEVKYVSNLLINILKSQPDMHYKQQLIQTFYSTVISDL